MYMYLCTMPRGKKRSAKGSNFKEDNSSLPHYTVYSKLLLYGRNCTHFFIKYEYICTYLEYGRRFIPALMPHALGNGFFSSEKEPHILLVISNLL